MPEKRKDRSADSSGQPKKPKTPDTINTGGRSDISDFSLTSEQHATIDTMLPATVHSILFQVNTRNTITNAVEMPGQLFETPEEYINPESDDSVSPE